MLGLLQFSEKMLAVRSGFSMRGDALLAWDLEPALSFWGVLGGREKARFAWG